MSESNLNYLPEEMKDAQGKLNDAMKRVYRAQRQAKLWNTELDLAEKDRRIVESWYGTVSMRWDPKTNTMDPPSDRALEECP